MLFYVAKAERKCRISKYRCMDDFAARRWLPFSSASSRSPFFCIEILLPLKLPELVGRFDEHLLDTRLLGRVTCVRNDAER